MAENDTCVRDRVTLRKIGWHSLIVLSLIVGDLLFRYLIYLGQKFLHLEPATADDIGAILSWFLKGVVLIFVSCGAIQLMLYGIKSILETGSHLFGKTAIMTGAGGAGQNGDPE